MNKKEWVKPGISTLGVEKTKDNKDLGWYCHHCGAHGVIIGTPGSEGSIPAHDCIVKPEPGPGQS